MKINDHTCALLTILLLVGGVTGYYYYYIAMPTVMAFVDPYTAGYNRGWNDSNRDAVAANGHGCDPTTPSGHTARFAQGYAAGYDAGRCGTHPRLSSSSPPSSNGCYNMNDAGSAWIKGYQDAQNDHKGINGHGYDPSTSLTGVDKVDYQSGYQQGWTDASRGVYGPFC